MMDTLYKAIQQYCAIFLTGFFLTGCGADLRVGILSGTDAKLIKLVKTLMLQEHQIKLKIVEFHDDRLLNTALNDGGLDANIFQHQFFLKEELKRTDYRLVAIGNAFAYPLGIYSYQYTHLYDIQRGATVSLPSDPSNQTRALKLLEKSGLIKLDIDVGSTATVANIRYNPKNLRFVLMPANRLSGIAKRLQKDITLSVLDINQAISAGLSPNSHALFLESNSLLYTNLIVVKKSDKDKPALKKLAAMYRDEEVVDYAKQLFEGKAIGDDGGESGIRTRGRL